MKILIPVLGFGKSGGYRVLARLATELINKGCEVDFLSPSNSDLPYYPSKAGIIWLNTKGNIINKNNNVIAQTIFINHLTTLFKGLKSNSFFKYDIILVNHSLTSYPIFFSGNKKRALYYVQAYEPDYYKVGNSISHQLLRYLSLFSYKMGFYTIGNSEIYRNYKWLHSSEVVMPGLDLSVFKPFSSCRISEKRFNSDKKIRIGTIGRLEKYKGTFYIFEAFKELRKKIHNIELHIAFASPTDWGNFPGVFYFKPDGDIALAQFYNSLDMYICAGISQLGAVHYPVIESMACGIPVITTKYYPASEENARIIIPKSKQSIEMAIIDTVNNFSETEKKMQYGLKSITQFEWGDIGQKMYKIISKH